MGMTERGRWESYRLRGEMSAQARPGESLQELHPQIAARFVRNETHPHRTPDALTCQSNDRCVWECENRIHKEYPKVVAKRVGSKSGRRQGCPDCSELRRAAASAVVAGERGIATTYSKLAAQFVRCLRYEHLTAAQLGPGSDLCCDWRCPDCGDVFSSTVANRVAGKGHGPCSNKKRLLLAGTTDRVGDSVVGLYSDEAAQFLRNLDRSHLGIDQLRPFSNDEYLWLCPCGEEYSRTVSGWSASAKVCPACSNAITANKLTGYDASQADAAVRKLGYVPLEPYPGKVDERWRLEHNYCGKPCNSARLNKLLAGQPCCPTCQPRTLAQRFAMSHEDATARAENCGFTPLEPYPGRNSERWRCLHHDCQKEVRITLTSIGPGYGCPICACHGRDLVNYSIVYLMTHDSFNAIKVGVTSLKETNSRGRVAHHERYGWRLLDALTFDTGQMAYDQECRIKQALGDSGFDGGVVSRELMPSRGEGETYRMDALDTAWTFLRDA